MKQRQYYNKIYLNSFLSFSIEVFIQSLSDYSRKGWSTRDIIKTVIFIWAFLLDTVEVFIYFIFRLFKKAMKQRRGSVENVAETLMMALAASGESQENIAKVKKNYFFVSFFFEKIESVTILWILLSLHIGSIRKQNKGVDDKNS